MKYFKSTFFIALFTINFIAYAFDSIALERQADTTIKELYHRLDSMPNTSMTERVNWISQHFLGVIYILDSLGEGPKALYDQFPRYRIDGFDCETYVNTVLALALGHSLPSFKQCLQYTRYENGNISYLNRNHFTSVDWNKNNQQRGVLEDITLSIHNQKNQSPAKLAIALIDKPGWYAHKTVSTIRLSQDNLHKQQSRLEELKIKGSQLKSILSKIPYIPLTALFNKDKPDLYLFSQIPHGSIIEIVRPNWDLRSTTGSALNISHMGFAIRINDQLYFRQASSIKGKIVDVSLIEYLKKAQSSPTIKGINVQRILATKPLAGNCARIS